MSSSWPAGADCPGDLPVGVRRMPWGIDEVTQTPIEVDGEMVMSEDWLACQHPERPFDMWTLLHHLPGPWDPEDSKPCRGCHLALEAEWRSGEDAGCQLLRWLLDVYEHHSP